MALSQYFLQLHITLHLLENCSSQINDTSLYYKDIFIGKKCKTTELSGCKRKGQIFTLLQKLIVFIRILYYLLNSLWRSLDSATR